MQLLDGKKRQKILKQKLLQKSKMIDKGEKVPHLAAVIVGNDGGLT
jgi:methylenetetrahydrofolate dehydrogenase (NADP+)/methenyltetrahydrofolate cyclohydrolase